MDTQTQFTRSANFRPSTLNREKRTVRVTVSTGATVRRRGYDERLILPDPQSIVGLPVLNAHRQDSLDSLVGRVIAAGRDSAGLWADITLSERADWLLNDIEAGIITSASIGYGEASATETVEKGRRVRTINPAIREISLVPVPADAGATIRSNFMEIEDEDLNNPLATPMPDEDAARIRSLGELADLPPSVAEGLITRNATIDEARTEIRSALIERSRSVPRIRVQSPASENPAEILERRTEALTVRVAGGELSEQARPFINDRLIDHARAAVERAGISTRMMDTDQIFRAAMHSTSDFPQLLTGVGNRTLLPAYAAAVSPLKRIARQATAPDFRPTSRLRISGTGTLEKVSESGEIKSTSRSENVEGYALDTYASIFSLTRKTLINDDLGAFRDWGIAAGRAAAQTEANLLYSVLTANGLRGAKLSDGKALFHADHKNLTATAGQGIKDIGADALNDAKLKIARQTDLDGKTPLSAKGKFILVRPELEDDALRLIADIYPATVADVNVNTARYEVLTDPRITTDDFWLFADPASFPVLEYAYLSSAPGPQLASREGWDVLGTEWRVVLDFGVGAIDFRGAALIADV